MEAARFVGVFVAIFVVFFCALISAFDVSGEEKQLRISEWLSIG
jgi:hypothetical protein